MAGPEKGRRCNGPGKEMGASARLGYRGRRKEIGRDMGLWLGIGGGDRKWWWEIFGCAN